MTSQALPAGFEAREPRESKRWSRALTALALLTGFWLRLTGLEVHSLWFDEGHTTWLASAPNVLELLHADRHPPLSFLAYGAWIDCFGEGDGVLRFLPALLSCMALLGFAALARAWLERPARTVAVALYSVAPFHVWHAQELRMYAFLELGAVLALLGSSEFLVGSRIRGCALALVGSAVAFGSHYMGFLVVPTVIGVAAAVSWSKSGGGNWRTLAPISAASAAGPMLWAPWLVAALGDQLASSWGYAAKLGVRDLAELPVRQVLTELSAIPPQLRWSGVLLSVVLLLGFAAAFVRLLLRFERRHLPPALAFTLPVGIALVATLVSPPNFTPKYLMVAAPGTVLLIATGLCLFHRRIVTTLLATLAVGGALTLSLLHRQGNLREDYRSACLDLASNWQPGDKVVSITGTPEPYGQSAPRHYLRERPDILASIEPLPNLHARLDRAEPALGRVHVIYRDAGYSRDDLTHLSQRLTLLERSPDRFRVSYLQFAARGP